MKVNSEVILDSSSSSDDEEFLEKIRKVKSKVLKLKKERDEHYKLYQASCNHLVEQKKELKSIVDKYVGVETD